MSFVHLRPTFLLSRSEDTDDVLDGLGLALRVDQRVTATHELREVVNPDPCAQLSEAGSYTSIV